MPLHLPIFCLALLCLLAPSLPAREALVLLRDECLRCHDEEKRRGGLLMTSREALLQGGDSGPALLPGKSSESSLFTLLAPEADPHMPPKEQLPEPDIATLQRWIDEGAPWDSALLASSPLPPTDFALSPLPPSYQPVTALTLSPAAPLLAASRGSRIEVFDVSTATPALLATLTGHLDAVQSLAWSPDGKMLASGGFRKVLLWEAATWDRVAHLQDPLEGRVTAILFAEDKLVTADSVAAIQGRLHLWNLADFSLATTLKPHRDTIFHLALSPDGAWAASASADKLVHLWDPRSWEPRFTLEGHTGFVLSTIFSPQSDRLATAGDDETVKVWSLESQKQIHGFAGRLSSLAVTGLTWHTDPAAKPAPPASKDTSPPPVDDWIVAVSEDGRPRAYTKLQVHDGTQTSGGATERPWDSAGEPLSALAWLPASKLLAAGTVSGRIQLWDAQGKLAGSLD